MIPLSCQGVRAVFVTWNPDLERLIAAVESVSTQVDGVVIVDNGSRNYSAISDYFATKGDTEIVELGENRGVGAALNVGVARVLLKNPAWVMTMDQDTLVDPGAVSGILDDFATLDEKVQRRCAVLALRPQPQPASFWLTRYADGLLELGDRGRFTERRGVITSGNLVRADLAHEVRFNESMFIDQVDFDFCFSLRRRGYLVMRQKVITMDHILGERYHDVSKVHPYENAQRYYYIVRNSSYMVLRRRLLLRHYVSQMVLFSGAFVSINGVAAFPLTIRIVVRGIIDASVGRMGRREYAFLGRGRR